MDADGLAWLRARTRHAATLYDRFRLDHVVGYFRQFIRRAGPTAEGAPKPKGAFDPEGEEAQLARGTRVLSVMQEEAGGARIIAEDLGVIPPFVRETLARLGVPGYRVIPWEKDDATGYRDPTRYPVQSLATWSTHDTAPIVSWWNELPEGDRASLAKMAELPPDSHEPERSLSLLRLLFKSSSELSLVLATELLGQPDRINTPGTVGEANWTYRPPMPIEDLEKDRAVVDRCSRIRELVAASGR
jgi:4-alpha-glucanotransferase